MERALNKEAWDHYTPQTWKTLGRFNTETLGVRLINKNERAADHVQWSWSVYDSVLFLRAGVIACVCCTCIKKALDDSSHPLGHEFIHNKGHFPSKSLLYLLQEWTQTWFFCRIASRSFQLRTCPDTEPSKVAPKEKLLFGSLKLAWHSAAIKLLLFLNYN